ncbi:hypothetical protein V1358_02430 [Pseudoalteromonas sp. YIC-656]|uniref:hypothetical protein n=1 Tax=Pseudoalteromonas pernae TaxID=3118054 RepID=UPI003242A4B3
MQDFLLVMIFIITALIYPVFIVFMMMFSEHLDKEVFKVKTPAFFRYLALPLWSDKYNKLEDRSNKKLLFFFIPGILLACCFGYVQKAIKDKTTSFFATFLAVLIVLDLTLIIIR